MAEKQINTVIVLRNDETSNWNASEKVLKKGEIGLEYREDGSVMIKAGDNENKFADLAYVGSDVKPAQVFQVNRGEASDDVAAITAAVNGKELSVGDIAIVKAGIAGDKTAYTSYVYDGANWVATDGNYSATNVYFKDDITLAGSYTAVGNVKKSSNAATGTLSAAGKSLAEIMQSIFTQELYPVTGTSRDLPSISISGLSDTSGEVGTSYALPTAKVTVDDVGAYTYGPATGIVFEQGKLTLAQGAIDTATNKVSNTATMKKSSTLSLTATDTATLYTDSVKTYTFNAAGEYTQGAMPVTNLGNDYSSARIDAGTATATAKSAKRTGWRNYWYGFISTTSYNTISRNTTNNNVGDGTKTLTAGGKAIAAGTLPTITAASGDRMPVVVMPTAAAKSVTSATMPSSLNAPVTFTKLGTVELEGYNGYTKASYDVWGYVADDMPVGADFSIVIG